MYACMYAMISWGEEEVGNCLLFVSLSRWQGSDGLDHDRLALERRVGQGCADRGDALITSLRELAKLQPCSSSSFHTY